MNNKQLSIVTFEQAQVLKKLGFDWTTTTFYNPDDEFQKISPLHYSYGVKDFNAKTENPHIDKFISAPTISLTLKWIRDLHNLSGEIFATASGWRWKICKALDDLTGGTDITDSGFDGPNDGGAWDTYEDCAKCCLDELLNLIENEDTQIHSNH